MESNLGWLKEETRKYLDSVNRVEETKVTTGILNVLTRATELSSWRKKILIHPVFLTFCSTDIIHFKHAVRSTYLTTSRNYQFNQRNCGYRCPIMGQLEVNGQKSRNYQTEWRMHSGLLFLNDEFSKESSDSNHNDYDSDL
jgi:hypothetical protein